MDYIRLKKTLIAVFDHFLSCHDMAELEEMMQAFEDGKSLVIKLPEAVEREDYIDDVLGHEEQRKSDNAAMAAPEPKKTISRVRRKKPKTVIKTDIKQIKICDVPVLIDLSKLSKEKRSALRDVLSGNHHAQIHDFKMSDMHGFAKLRVFKVVEADRESPIVRSFGSGSGMVRQALRPLGRDSSFSFSGEQTKQKTDNASDRILKENLIQKIMFEIKKHKDPP